jgi:hypothetical protein
LREAPASSITLDLVGSTPQTLSIGIGVEVASLTNITEINIYLNMIIPSNPSHRDHDLCNINIMSTIAQKNTSLFDPCKIIWLLLRSLFSTSGNGKAGLRISKSCTPRLGVSATT